LKNKYIHQEDMRMKMIMVAVVVVGSWAMGCASVPSAPPVYENDPNIAFSRQDSLLMAVDRTDYATNWVGQYEGPGNTYGEKLKKWEEGRMNLSIRYGKKTADGRTTLAIEGWSSAISEGTRFGFQTAEINDTDELVGVYVIHYSHLKFEFSLIKENQKIKGHVKEYKGEDKYGPFHPTSEWKFEVDKVEVE
jgi:hypothetical protein